MDGWNGLSGSNTLLRANADVENVGELGLLMWPFLNSPGTLLKSSERFRGLAGLVLLEAAEVLISPLMRSSLAFSSCFFSLRLNVSCRRSLVGVADVGVERGEDTLGRLTTVLSEMPAYAEIYTNFLS